MTEIAAKRARPINRKRIALQLPEGFEPDNEGKYWIEGAVVIEGVRRLEMGYDEELDLHWIAISGLKEPLEGDLDQWYYKEMTSITLYIRRYHEQFIDGGLLPHSNITLRKGNKAMFNPWYTYDIARKIYLYFDTTRLCMADETPEWEIHNYTERDY